MQEINGNIWEQYDLGRWIVITTNGEVRKDGACVMGRGIAKQAADKFPDLPYTLGSTIKEGRGKTYCVLNGVPAHKWRTYEFLLDGKRRKLTERETEVAFTYAGRRLADGGYCDWDDFKRNE